jgi:hypothetical protein
MFEVGFHPQIPRRITTLPAEITSRELRRGLLKATGLRNGQQRDLFYGFMVNVRVSPAPFRPMS